MDELIVFDVEQTEDGGFIAHPAEHPIFIEADTWEALREAARDAVQRHFDADEMPQTIRLLWHMTAKRRRNESAS